jgi:shikimate dehydrogenase
MRYFHKIDKDTLLYASFAKKAGSKGCAFFNELFLHHQINAIYKSFSVEDIEGAINAAKTLNIKGFAITMPFKQEALKHINETSEEVKKIRAANTIINKDNYLKAYNTDYIAAKQVLGDSFKKNSRKKLYILGDGGYSKAVQYAASLVGFQYELITRNKWEDIKNIKNSIIYNCTPVEQISVDSSNGFIDCVTTSLTGQRLSRIQAEHQFKLYTGAQT